MPLHSAGGRNRASERVPCASWWAWDVVGAPWCTGKQPTMTRQSSFKRRVRARMATTGERYAAARRALLAAHGDGRRRWAADPGMGDDAVRAATGRGWDDWCDAIEAWPGHLDGHAAIAAHIHATHGLDHWWAQGVTVGFELITGRRLPYQRADGTFAASRSRTVDVACDELRAALLDEDGRAELFPGHDTELRSRPGSRSIRLALAGGVVLLTLDAVADGRTRVAVEHGKLPDPAAVEEWRFWWGEWLEALDG